MNKIHRSLKIAYSLLPTEYQKEKRYRQYHFAFLFKKKSLISIGINGYQPSPKIAYLGNKFKIEKYQKYNYPHAETDAISRIWGKKTIDNCCSLVIIRLNVFGELQNSKPCRNCQIIIDALGISDIWWSTKEGSITNSKGEIYG